jgi:hypothetical protein
MKFTITETKTEEIVHTTTREIEMEFPHYFKAKSQSYYIDNDGDTCSVYSEYFGVINRCAYTNWTDELRDHYVSIWMMTRKHDNRWEIPTVHSIEMSPAVEPSFVKDDMIKNKITKEEFFENLNEKKEILFA